MKTVYSIMDHRAQPGDKEGWDRAIAFEVCNSLFEARRNAPNYGTGCPIWRERLKKIGDREYETVGAPEFVEFGA